MSDEYQQQEQQDRTPQNIEAEAALLGGLMVDNRLVDEIAHVHLRAEHFFEPLHGSIYAAICARVANGEIANPVTLRPKFEFDERMTFVGGAGYLAQLTGSGAAVIGARDFAKQIVDLANLRALIGVAQTAIDRCIDTANEDATALEIAGDMETQVAEILVSTARKSTVTFAEALRESSQRIEDIGNGATPAGFKIARFSDWNAIVGRMEPGDFILLGGRPSMGKTAVGATVALGAAEGGIGTDFLSLEMDREKAMRRLIAELIYDPDDPLRYQDLIDGRLKRSHWRKIVNASADLEKLPLTISDPAIMAVEDVGPHIRKRQREFEKRGQQLQFVVLDYIGRLLARKKLQGETEIVSYISRQLKQAAKETGVALLALSQLSRAIEQRENKRPMLADLRQSGSLEQDADTVAFVYREEYYLERAEPKRGTEKWHAWASELEDCRGNLEIYSSKRREGALTKRVSKFLTDVQAVLDHHDPRVAGAPGLFDENDPGMRG